jgi:hypothetical protein
MDLEIHFPAEKDLADSVSYSSKERFSDQMILTLLGPYGAVEVAQPEKEIADLPSDPYLERHAWVVRKNRK